MVETSVADDVAHLVLDTFNALRSTGKPSVRSNGIAEWSVFAGLIVQRTGTHCAKLIAPTFL
jgi:hypothetical protein